MPPAGDARQSTDEEGRREVATRFAGGRWWRWREPGIRGHQAAAGWLFLAPVIVILGVFLLLPIAAAA